MSALFPELGVAHVPLVPGERTAGDKYYTPDVLAQALVEALHGEEDLDRRGWIWEPHSGGGAFVRALHAAGAAVLASDMDPTAAALWLRLPGLHVIHGASDFLEGTYAPQLHDERFEGLPEWIIGNPPYDRAEEHVRQALALTGRHAAFLLRLAFVESLARVPFWREHRARKIWALARRPSFSGAGTDSCAYGFFWWDRHYDGPTHFEPGWDWQPQGGARVRA